jgi:hypothetical protein
MKNIVEYSLGYLDGIQRGKRKFMDSLGKSSVEIIKQYVDASARVNPSMLQHMYEWEQSGSPSARLFDIDYTVSNLGLSIMSSFRQSATVKSGSNVPFYDKARIMESGIPVTIKPKKAEALSFVADSGETIFTKSPVIVSNPGGDAAAGGFQKTLDTFMDRYFSQAFLRSSGVDKYLENQILYKKNLSAGKSVGRSVGVNTGYKWIANAGIIL